MCDYIYVYICIHIYMYNLYINPDPAGKNIAAHVLAEIEGLEQHIQVEFHKQHLNTKSKIQNRHKTDACEISSRTRNKCRGGAQISQKFCCY